MEDIMRMPDQMRKDEIVTVPIYFRLEKSEFTKLKKICVASKINTTALVRNIIADYIRYYEAKSLMSQ